MTTFNIKKPMHRFVFAIWSNTEETWKGQLIKNSSFIGLALYFSLLCINKNNSTKKFNDMCGKPWFFWMQNTRGDSIYPKLKGLNIHEKGLHLVSFVKNIYNSWKLITFSIYQYTVCHFFFDFWELEHKILNSVSTMKTSFIEVSRNIKWITNHFFNVRYFLCI